jgi:hypothetical protein
MHQVANTIVGALSDEDPAEVAGSASPWMRDRLAIEAWFGDDAARQRR